MSPEELVREFSLRGHPARVRGSEAQLATCLFCGNPNHNLEASATKGVYHCWACGEGGTVADLLTLVGATPPPDLEVALDRDDASPRPEYPGQWPSGTVPVAEVGSALAYVRSRGVTEAEARWLGIGVTPEPRVVFPMREYWDGSPVGHVTRDYVGDGPRYMSFVRALDSLPGWRGAEGSAHVLVEGVFDALAVKRAGHGAACLLGTGRADEALRWATRAPSRDHVVVCLDPEAVERAAYLYHAIKAARRRTCLLRLTAGTDPGATDPARLAELIREAMEGRK